MVVLVFLSSFAHSSGAYDAIPVQNKATLIQSGEPKWDSVRSAFVIECVYSTLFLGNVRVRLIADRCPMEHWID